MLRNLVSGPIRFALDVSSPFAAELLESLIEAGERVGCHAIFGTIHGDALEIVASDEIPQSLICTILAGKMKAKHSAVPSTTEADRIPASNFSSPSIDNAEG